MAEVEQPIIIKRITINGGGHHGGAWKVAYADFVTAMMAFFLLLWLLSSASDGQLQGIADYFTPTIGLKDSMGIGFDGGTTDAVEDGTQRKNLSRPSIVTGAPPPGVKPKDPTKKAVIESPEGEDLLFEKSAASIEQAVKNDPALKDLGENLRMEQTPEGLKIQVMDTEKDPMFFPGSVELSDAGKRLLARIGDVIKGMPNHLSITGHTDGVAFDRGGQTNWELSTERANAARRYLSTQGMVADRIAKIQGRAEKELLYPNDPKNPKNRRIEMILLRGDHMVIPEGDDPAGGLLPILDKQSDILKFEERRKQESLHKEKQVPEPAYSPAEEVPTVPLKEKGANAAEGKEVLSFGEE